MTTPNDLSDKALAVFAFAAYHQLDSGDVIKCIVARDESGQRAHPSAVSELVQKDLAVVGADRLDLTAAGELMLSQIVDRIRGSW